MSVYSEMGRNSKPQGAPGEDLNFVEISGDFYCTHPGCRDYSETAMFFPEKGILSWRCKTGHMSASEGIDL